MASEIPDHVVKLAKTVPGFDLPCIEHDGYF